jgi:hypothetical protein
MVLLVKVFSPGHIQPDVQCSEVHKGRETMSGVERINAKRKTVAAIKVNHLGVYSFC